MPHYQLFDGEAEALFKAGSQLQTGMDPLKNSNDDTVFVKIANRLVPKPFFRDWSLGFDYTPNYRNLLPGGSNTNSDAGPSYDLSNDSDDPTLVSNISTIWNDSDINNEHGEFSLNITSSTITFFVGSGLLLLAGLFLIIIVVLAQKLFRRRRWKQHLRSKKVKSIKKVILYPIQQQLPPLNVDIDVTIPRASTIYNSGSVSGYSSTPQRNHRGNYYSGAGPDRQKQPRIHGHGQRHSQRDREDPEIYDPFEF